VIEVDDAATYGYGNNVDSDEYLQEENQDPDAVHAN
jgi:hypothetical protein